MMTRPALTPVWSEPQEERFLRESYNRAQAMGWPCSLSACSNDSSRPWI